MPLSRSRTFLATAATVALILVGAPVAAGDDPTDGPGATDRGRVGTELPRSSPSGFAARTVAASGADLAAAMDIPADGLIEADISGSDPRAFAISDGTPLGNPTPPTDPTDPTPVPMLQAASTGSGGLGFPTKGDTFLIMSTGDASQALTPNTSPSLTTLLDGSDNEQGNDLAQLRLRLQPPDGARCLAFDFAFYSEEYPEYVGSSFNDAFTAQLGTGETRIVDGAVEADSNFAEDEQQNPLSINTVFGMHPNTSTTYDGGTNRLRAFAPVLGFEMEIFLTIQDLGDSSYDSAVILDNFFWSTDRICRFGSTQDSDGDGLLDEWETDGLTLLTWEGQQFLDLPAMGADPAVPDVFVEVDYMVDDDHSHRPDPAAIADVVASFADQGVHLHVDYGRSAPLTWGDASTWGDLSRADALAHTNNLGDNGLFGWFSYRWGAFDDIKAEHFDDIRAAVFHYNIWAHHLAEQDGKTSGRSRGVEGGASDFIVSLGEWSGDTGTVANQAGTFMHELGHNLGLGHGGIDHVNNKPNYLSVMNYMFQSGLPADNPGNEFDYSRYALVDLDEKALVESEGIRQPSWVFTKHQACLNSSGTPKLSSEVAGAIDWNCDGDTDDVIERDVNADGQRTILHGANDWDALVYTGGAIGMPGAIIELPAETFDDEPEMTYEQYVEQYAEQLDGTPVVDVAPATPTTPVPVGVTVDVEVPFTMTVGDGSDVTVTWEWSDGAVTDGVVTAGEPLVATGAHAFTVPGVHSVVGHLTSSAGTVSTDPAELVVIDPAAGGVSALGLIQPARGAYPEAPGARGTAVLAVDARYVRHDALLGGTLLTWPSARLTVVGRDFGWLIVQDDTATLDGAAYVNGRPGYRQRITVVGGRAPQVRVQVWDPDLGDIDEPAATVLDTTAGGDPARITGLVRVGS